MSAWSPKPALCWHAALAMNSSGVVADVLVSEGNTVQAQQELIVLNTRRQEAIVARRLPIRRAPRQRWRV
jgi:acetyl/propionyl-CoA carboxylase alpha subunit